VVRWGRLKVRERSRQAGREGGRDGVRARQGSREDERRGEKDMAIKRQGVIAYVAFVLPLPRLVWWLGGLGGWSVVVVTATVVGFCFEVFG
jgi:hypothetical protein